VLEAISYAEEICGSRLNYKLSEECRSGDHIWWIRDVRKFQQDYPDWAYRYTLEMIIREIVEATQERVRI
jgi:CDP-paratose 2-epimerase